MKNITMSIVAVLAMNTAVFAGGDIAPVEPEITVPEVCAVETTPGAFYVGLGYSYVMMNEDPLYDQNDVAYTADTNAHSALLLAGYNFNQYIGVEGRYTMNVGDVTYDNGTEYDYADDISNWGIYLKPMYPIGGVTVYALLGYGETTYDVTSNTFANNGEFSQDGFQWGLGASYAINDNFGIFVDYTRLNDDTGFDTYNVYSDVVVDSVNVGVTYTF